MNLGYRKINFCVGLNLWGLGVLFSAKALEYGQPAGWLIPLFLLYFGTWLLMAALIVDGSSHHG